MKLLYLGYICSDDLFAEISKEDMGSSHARQRWEQGFISSLVQTGEIDADDVTALTFLPQTNIKIPEGETISGVKVQYFVSSRSKITVLLKTMKKVRKEICAWLKQTEGEERIAFTYATNLALLLPLLMVKPADFRVISACSEVPAFRIYEGKSRFANWLKKTVFEYLHNRMSGYVFFSRHDNDVANKHKKPWTVCEGMAQLPPEREYGNEQGCDIIFYAGGLNVEYGIRDLLDAFIALNRKDTELWLCGSGNAELYIQECMEKNSSIKYLGRRSNQEVLEMEAKASLLINPRPKDQMFTKYSFPSKTLEYMASGTPAMIKRLEGIPDEYFNYAYIIEEDGAPGIEKALKQFFNEPQSLRYQKGKEARQFVKAYKTPVPQTFKILDFLKKNAQQI